MDRSEFSMHIPESLLHSPLIEDVNFDTLISEMVDDVATLCKSQGGVPEEAYWAILRTVQASFHPELNDTEMPAVHTPWTMDPRTKEGQAKIRMPYLIEQALVGVEKEGTMLKYTFYNHFNKTAVIGFWSSTSKRRYCNQCQF